MDVPRRRLPAARIWLGALAAFSTVVLLLLQLPAGAVVNPPTPTAPVTANSTYFDGLGQPYGGCGLPQANLDSQDFVALNVFNTPGDYTFYPRPIPASLADKIGIWNNGLNCGRYVQVTIGDFCTGVNDGAPNQPFCRNGSWVSDNYNGATLTMLVADSCGDSNAWCRDDPYHLDLAKASLNRFVKNGAQVFDLLPNHYNNRHISWAFVPAPSYSGDINIGFLQGAQVWWPAISVSHLANGIHGVEFLVGGVWQRAQMNSDMGQSYIIGGTTSGGSQFQIRVLDANDTLINNGRVYSFTLPSSCSSQCSVPYTQTTYTTSGGSSSSPSASASSRSPSPSVSPSRSPSSSPSSSPPPAGGCRVTYARQSEWAGGFVANVTIANTGTTAVNGWTLRFTFGGDQRITSSWGATTTANGAAVTATNVDYTATVPAGGSTSFGFQGTWAASDASPTSFTLNNTACSTG
jgi:hypothetical protein